MYLKRQFTYYLLPIAVLVLLIACTGSDNPVGNSEIPQPQEFYIISIFPNPTDTLTTLKVGLADSAFVRLYVQNPVGKKLYTVIEDTLAAGMYTREWDLSSDAGKKLRNGLYFLTLEIPAKNFRQSKIIECR